MKLTQSISFKGIQGLVLMGLFSLMFFLPSNSDAKGKVPPLRIQIDRVTSADATVSGPGRLKDIHAEGSGILQQLRPGLPVSIRMNLKIDDFIYLSSPIVCGSSPTFVSSAAIHVVIKGRSLQSKGRGDLQYFFGPVEINGEAKIDGVLHFVNTKGSFSLSRRHDNAVLTFELDRGNCKPIKVRYRIIFSTREI